MYQPPDLHRRQLLSLAQVVGVAIAVVAVPAALLLLEQPRPAPLTLHPETAAPGVSVESRTGTVEDPPYSPPRHSAPVPVPPLDFPHPPVTTAVALHAAAPGEPTKSTAERKPSGAAKPSGDTPREPGEPAAENTGSSTSLPSIPGPALVTASPGSPVPDTGSHEFDLYVRWLQSVENERERLRSYSRTSGLRFASAGAGPSGPVLAPEAAASPPTERLDDRDVQGAMEAVRGFSRRIQRQKPPVPPDCASFDRYYGNALDSETSQTTAYLEALGQGNRDRLASLRRAGVAGVDRTLDQAEGELERVWAGRGGRAPFRLRTGERASLLGELTR